jgi:15-cis-phytoene synthase
MTPKLEAAFRACRGVAWRNASNFACIEWLLPLDQRRGMQALYAFARRCDDIADSPEPLDHRRRQLAAWREQLRRALAGQAEDPILVALADTVSRFVVPQHLLWRIVEGVAMDLNHSGYASYADLRRYGEHVASAVGLSCLAIWGCRDDEAILPAADCGVAFQLTNILRDLQEDGRRGRIYLPHDELARFGVAPIDWLGDVGTQNLRDLLTFQCQRAAGLFAAGLRTERYLDLGPQRVFRLMWTTYRALLARIERNPLIVLRRRVCLSLPTKLFLASKLLFIRS